MKNQAMECLSELVAEKINEGYILENTRTLYSSFEYLVALRKGTKRIAVAIEVNYDRDDEIQEKYNISIFAFRIHDVVFIPNFENRMSETQHIQSFYYWKNCCSSDITELVKFYKRQQNNNFIDNIFKKEIITSNKLFELVRQNRGFKTSSKDDIIVSRFHNRYIINTKKSKAEIMKRVANK